MSLNRIQGVRILAWSSPTTFHNSASSKTVPSMQQNSSFLKALRISRMAVTHVLPLRWWMLTTTYSFVPLLRFSTPISLNESVQWISLVNKTMSGNFKVSGTMRAIKFLLNFKLSEYYRWGIQERYATAAVVLPPSVSHRSSNHIMMEAITTVRPRQLNAHVPSEKFRSQRLVPNLESSLSLSCNHTRIDRHRDLQSFILIINWGPSIFGKLISGDRIFSE